MSQAWARAAAASWSDLQAQAEADTEMETGKVESVIPSNHYGLLTHFSRFVAHC
jgi:hypothetical protein